MRDIKWNNTEKKIARSIFDAALAAEQREIVLEFRQKASAAENLGHLYEMHEWLRERLKQFEYEYDYRYSVLLPFLGKLLREKRISLDDLQGFSEEKLTILKSFIF